jgi:hypothetical protein
MKKLIIFLMVFLVACGGSSTEEKTEQVDKPDPVDTTLDNLFFEYALISDNGDHVFRGTGARRDNIIYFTPKTIANSSNTVITEFYINDNQIIARIFRIQDRSIYKEIDIDYNTRTGKDQDGNLYDLELLVSEEKSKAGEFYEGVDRFGCSGDDCAVIPTECDYKLHVIGYTATIDMSNCKNISVEGSYNGVAWSNGALIKAVATNGNNAIALSREL